MAQSQGDNQPDAEQTVSPAALDLADIVPLATKLTGRLADLKKRLRDGLNIAAVEKQYDGIESRLHGLAGQMEGLRQSQKYKYNQLVEQKGAIKQENELYEIASLPIRRAIRQLEDWRKAWTAEQMRWDGWEASLQQEGDFEQLQTTFEKADGTIETALELVLSRLAAVLVLQERGGGIQNNISAMDVELTAMIEDERRSALLDESPPMLSLHFFSPFKSGEIWSAAMQIPDEITWPDSRFFARYGWIVFLQVVVSIFVMISTYRNRLLLSESSRWRFFAARLFSAGLFVGYMSTALIYEYIEDSRDMEAGYDGCGCDLVCAIDGRLDGPSWKRQFINGLMVVLIVTLTMDVLSFPIPLFRLYTIFTALAGAFFCWRWAAASARNQDSRRSMGGCYVRHLFFLR